MGIIMAYLFFCLVTSLTSIHSLYLPTYKLLALSEKNNIFKNSPFLSAIVFMIMSFIFAPAMIIIMLTCPETFIRGMASGVQEK